MKLIMNVALAAAVAALAGCSRGKEAAPGSPRTDITETSREHATPGSRQYIVLSEARNGQQTTIDVKVNAPGLADDIGREVVKEKKGDATAVTVRVFAPDQQRSQQPMRTIEWSAANGFSEAATGR